MELSIDSADRALRTIENREKWIARSSAYYGDIVKRLQFFVPEGASVLEVGCSTGWLIRQIDGAGHRVGVDKRSEYVAAARASNVENTVEFLDGDFEKISLGRRFDFIIISDVVPFAHDVQRLFENAKAHLKPGGRVFVSTYNAYLRPIYRLAELLGLKRRSSAENWFSEHDVYNICDLVGFEVVRQGTGAIIPWDLLGLGGFINRWLGPLPIFKFTNLYGYYLFRDSDPKPKNFESVSVVIPARNEAGNIAAAITRMPRLSEKVEVIFVEGHSSDDTWEAICKTTDAPHPSWMSIKRLQQSGKGKANAVHEGFAGASGDVLLILDADLTVMPEELPRFIEILKAGLADFVHGSRLVYPMEGAAMRFLNVLGNKFFSMAFTFILGQRFKDTLCGTKVLYREDWARILKLRKYFGDFDPFGDFELLFGAVKLNHKVAEIPVHYKSRSYGETNIHRFRHGWILLKMVLFAAPRMRFY
jgi:SAM-dependent methyltransferase